MKLWILREAEEEPHASAIWYDEQLGGLGDDFLDELSAAMQQIEDDPDPFSSVGIGEIQTVATLPPPPISRLDYLRNS